MYQKMIKMVKKKNNLITKIKKIIYKNQDSDMLDKELRDKFKRYINVTTKRGECFTE